LSRQVAQGKPLVQLEVDACQWQAVNGKLSKSRLHIGASRPSPSRLSRPSPNRPSPSHPSCPSQGSLSMEPSRLLPKSRLRRAVRAGRHQQQRHQHWYLAALVRAHGTGKGQGCLLYSNSCGGGTTERTGVGVNLSQRPAAFSILYGRSKVSGGSCIAFHWGDRV